MTLFDVVYWPWPTPIACAAQGAGSTVIGELPMLLHRAARQVEPQTGRAPAPLDAMRRAAEGALATGAVSPLTRGLSRESLDGR
ncbi:shikimate 5-dehydrogenase [Streptomyces sp. ADI92-24]|uniref:hypothetical protein n=1 Tax=Streptomyces sp. ADI92-24 TaxID=1522756 RepID=UPI000F5554AD|nr:shikimate 5-dehydrogenase [Streptomyces sp. ADI92-24]